MSQEHPEVTRRAFLKCGAGLVAGGAAAAAISRQWPARKPAAASGDNPFAYRLDQRLSQTDPKLIHYEEIARFRSPRQDVRRIAVGPDDHLYLAAGTSISFLNQEGAVVSEITFPAPPRCLAVAGDGTLYAGLRDHIEIFGAKGERLAAWDTPPGRPWLAGLAIGPNDLFAADAGNRVVLRYDRSGKLVGRIGEKSQERNSPGFVVPSPFFDLELARDGLLRVANPGRHRVEAYTLDGDLELAWGQPSAAIDGFCGCCNPINLALLADNRVVTCEKGLPRVKVCGPDGKLQSVVAGPEAFPDNVNSATGEDRSDSTLGGLDAVVDSRGRIYILDLVTAEVRLMARKANAPKTTT